MSRLGRPDGFSEFCTATSGRRKLGRRVYPGIRHHPVVRACKSTRNNSVAGQPRLPWWTLSENSTSLQPRARIRVTGYDVRGFQPQHSLAKARVGVVGETSRSDPRHLSPPRSRHMVLRRPCVVGPCRGELLNSAPGLPGAKVGSGAITSTLAKAYLSAKSKGASELLNPPSTLNLWTVVEPSPNQAKPDLVGRESLSCPAMRMRRHWSVSVFSPAACPPGHARGGAVRSVVSSPANVKHMSGNRDVPVAWPHAPCMKRATRILLSVTHRPRGVGVLGRFLCCVPTKRYPCGWSHTRSIRSSPGGCRRILKSRAWSTDAPAYADGLRGTRSAAVLSDAVHTANAGHP